MICPKTNADCTNIAGCNLIGECNKPIPIAEFAARSPENAKLIENLIADLKSGKVCLS